MNIALQATHAIERLEEFLLALLYAKRTHMLPRNQHSSIERLVGQFRHKRALAYDKILDRVVFPFFPTNPLVVISDETKLPPDFTGGESDHARRVALYHNMPARVEVLLKGEDRYYWIGFRRRSFTGLRGLILPKVMPSDAMLIEEHTRFIDYSGQEYYLKALFILSQQGLYPVLWPEAPPYVFIKDELSEILNHHGNALEKCIHFTAHLQNFWQVRWTYQHKALIFGATERAMKSLGTIREGPRTTPSGRRNPLLHWVTEHLRRVAAGEQERLIPISEHLRGTERFVIDEYAAEIINPTKIGQGGVSVG